MFTDIQNEKVSDHICIRYVYITQNYRLTTFENGHLLFKTGKSDLRNSRKNYFDDVVYRVFFP